MAAERVKRLNNLMAGLNRLPPSPHRDRLISEVRSRAVDVDTGVTPRAMLPMHEPPLPPDAPKPPKRHVLSSVKPAMQPARAPAVKPTPPLTEPKPAITAESVFWAADCLSLEDDFSPLPHAADGGRVVRPWTLGLRG